MSAVANASMRVVAVASFAMAAAGASARGGMGANQSAPASVSVSNAPHSDWVQMFNGRDLSNWDIKFAKHELGDNFNDTFRVEDGLMKVRYDKWAGWNGEFGHIFGIMVMGQSAESMGLNQDFPISLEVQLLGGLGKGPRPTANLCTPGTNVHFGDSLITRHCTNSTSKTYDGDQWLRVEALVLGDSTSSTSRTETRFWCMQSQRWVAGRRATRNRACS
ncbi:MAG: hypothetical protein ABIT20_05540 [Gemmatimonadaceae bacterium]